MKFWEAMKALEEGKKVRPRDYPSSYYVYVGPRNNLCVHSPQGDFDKADCPLNRVYIDEWELYEEPEKTYTFMEVVKGLREGKSFVRAGRDVPDAISSHHKRWPGSYIFTALEPSHFTLEDLEATDWVEVK